MNLDDIERAEKFIEEFALMGSRDNCHGNVSITFLGEPRIYGIEMKMRGKKLAVGKGDTLMKAILSFKESVEACM